jgi:hypothetical protein
MLVAAARALRALPASSQVQEAKAKLDQAAKDLETFARSNEKYREVEKRVEGVVKAAYAVRAKVSATQEAKMEINSKALVIEAQEAAAMATYKRDDKTYSRSYERAVKSVVAAGGIIKPYKEDGITDEKGEKTIMAVVHKFKRTESSRTKSEKKNVNAPAAKNTADTTTPKGKKLTNEALTKQTVKLYHKVKKTKAKADQSKKLTDDALIKKGVQVFHKIKKTNPKTTAGQSKLAMEVGQD